MALKQDKAKLKKLINQKDRTEFIQEFIKFKDTYFNGNFKNASMAIGESREKVGGIFDRAGVAQGGQGSLLLLPGRERAAAAARDGTPAARFHAARLVVQEPADQALSRAPRGAARGLHLHGAR